MWRDKFKQHWRKWVGFALLFGESARQFKRLLDWLQTFDFVYERYNNPSWIGAGVNYIIDFVLNPPPWFSIVVIVVGFILIWRDNKKSQSPNIVEPIASPKPNLDVGVMTERLYVGEIQIGLNDLQQNRHAEITMRIFNGTGRVIEYLKVSGSIKFSAPNSPDSSLKGNLPAPSLQSNVATRSKPFSEWFLIFSQRVPAIEADKIVSMLKSQIPVHFDLSGLQIAVAEVDKHENFELLNLWHGITANIGITNGRIVSARGHIRASSAAVT